MSYLTQPGRICRSATTVVSSVGLSLDERATAIASLITTTELNVLLNGLLGLWITVAMASILPID